MKTPRIQWKNVPEVTVGAIGELPFQKAPQLGFRVTWERRREVSKRERSSTAVINCTPIGSLHTLVSNWDCNVRVLWSKFASNVHGSNFTGLLICIGFDCLFWLVRAFGWGSPSCVFVNKWGWHHRRSTLFDSRSPHRISLPVSAMCTLSWNDLSWHPTPFGVYLWALEAQWAWDY